MEGYQPKGNIVRAIEGALFTTTCADIKILWRLSDPSDQSRRSGAAAGSCASSRLANLIDLSLPTWRLWTKLKLLSFRWKHRIRIINWIKNEAGANGEIGKHEVASEPVFPLMAAWENRPQVMGYMGPYGPLAMDEQVDGRALACIPTPPVIVCHCGIDSLAK